METGRAGNTDKKGVAGTSADIGGVAGQKKTWKEINDYLDSLPRYEYSTEAKQRVEALLKELVPEGLDGFRSIAIAGTSGKSIAGHLASLLLEKEGYRAGVYHSTYILSRTEQVVIGGRPAASRKLTRVLESVIEAAEKLGIKATQHELMLVAAIMYFRNELISVGIFETAIGGKFDAALGLDPAIVAITKVAVESESPVGQDIESMATDFVEMAAGGRIVVTAEQSKMTLKMMKEAAERCNADWRVPVRKVAELPRVYYQLYGRIGALSERVAQIFVEDLNGGYSPFLRGVNAALRRGQRGRPKLQDRRRAEESLQNSLKHFWNENFSLPRSRFELHMNETPMLAVSVADTLDALEHTLLGVRLVNYDKPLEGCAVIVALKEGEDVHGMAKALKSLQKRVRNAEIAIVGGGDGTYEPSELRSEAADYGLKAQAFVSPSAAYESFKKKFADRKNSLIAVFGPYGAISLFWQERGLRKFQP